MVTVFGIRNCDTMKKAFVWLDAHSVAYTFVDYRQPGIAAEGLPRWCQMASWQALLNTRGTTWRQRSAAERADVDAAKAMQLMSQFPTLIRRPLIECAGHLLIGFVPDEYAAFLV